MHPLQGNRQWRFISVPQCIVHAFMQRARTLGREAVSTKEAMCEIAVVMKWSWEAILWHQRCLQTNRPRGVGTRIGVVRSLLHGRTIDCCFPGAQTVECGNMITEDVVAFLIADHVCGFQTLQ